MCEIITRSPVDGMGAVAQQPCSASHLFTSLFEFPAWPLRKSQDAIKKKKKKRQAIRLFSILTGLRTVRTCAEGGGGGGGFLPPTTTSTSTPLCFLSIKALRDGFNVDGK